MNDLRNDKEAMEAAAAAIAKEADKQKLAEQEKKASEAPKPAN